MFLVFAATYLIGPQESEPAYSFTRSQLIATQTVATGRSELLFTWDADEAKPWHVRSPQQPRNNPHPVFGFKGDAFWATDDTLQALTAFPDLEYVHLAYCCRISDDGIRHLSKLKSLRTLVLYRNQAKFGGNLLPISPAEASKLPQRLSDDALKHIALFPAIESLSIGDNQFSESAILGLAKCKTLKYLSIDDSQLSPTALAMLKRDMPDCEIDVWSGREEAGLHNEAVNRSTQSRGN